MKELTTPDYNGFRSNMNIYSLSLGNPGERVGVWGLRSRVVQPLTPNPSPRVQGEGSKSFKRESDLGGAHLPWHDAKPFERGRLAEFVTLQKSFADSPKSWSVNVNTIVPQIPEAYRNELPSPEQITERLRLWDQEREAANE